MPKIEFSWVDANGQPLVTSPGNPPTLITRGLHLEAFFAHALEDSVTAITALAPFTGRVTADEYLLLLAYREFVAFLVQKVFPDSFLHT